MARALSGQRRPGTRTFFSAMWSCRAWTVLKRQRASARCFLTAVSSSFPRRPVYQRKSAITARRDMSSSLLPSLSIHPSCWPCFARPARRQVCRGFVITGWSAVAAIEWPALGQGHTPGTNEPFDGPGAQARYGVSPLWALNGVIPYIISTQSRRLLRVPGWKQSRANSGACAIPSIGAERES